MRKLCYLLLTIILSNSMFGQAKFVKFEAKIANRNGDVIKITNIRGKKFEKIININKDGIFKDTLKVAGGMYRLSDGNESTELFLKNGYNLKLSMDAKQFDESIVYAGKGAIENNVLARRIIEDEKYYDDSTFSTTEDNFKKTLDTKIKGDLERLNNKKLDALFVSEEKLNIDNSIKLFQGNYNYFKNVNEVKNKLNNTQSASFDYENFAGGKSKLEDFKGKYVYIDVWATWCGPCRREIPFLGKIEEKYNGKNIAFVSISIDVQKDIEKWRTLVKEKQLGGVQLIADKDWSSDFVRSFGINGIPRFILIDPNGKIINADAERPSDPKLQQILDSLL